MDESLTKTWSEKDDIQELLSVFEAAISDTLNCDIEYTYVLEFISTTDLRKPKLSGDFHKITIKGNYTYNHVRNLWIYKQKKNI